MNANSTMVYLSIPYSGMEYQAFIVATAVAGKLMEEGNIVVCPVIQGHVLKNNGFDCEDILEHDIELLKRCDVVMVVCLDGWLSSAGVKAELEVADEFALPVIYLDPYLFVSKEEVKEWGKYDS